jgi:hypothetical protein
LRHTEEVSRDPRDERIAELEALVASLAAKLAAALKRIAELEEKVGESSRNSSKPPSRDPPSVSRPAKTSTGRKPGGQPGHKRHTREMFPLDKVRSVTECKPERCGHCQHRLRGEDPEPVRHQVADLPKIEPLVDEYRLQLRDRLVTHAYAVPDEHLAGERVRALACPPQRRLDPLPAIFDRIVRPRALSCHLKSPRVSRT